MEGMIGQGQGAESRTLYFSVASILRSRQGAPSRSLDPHSMRSLALGRRQLPSLRTGTVQAAEGTKTIPTRLAGAKFPTHNVLKDQRELPRAAGPHPESRALHSRPPLLGGAAS